MRWPGWTTRTWSASAITATSAAGRTSRCPCTRPTWPTGWPTTPPTRGGRPAPGPGGDGVGHLHAGGFVHRDLKPSNILLTADGRPAVSDFGLIKGLGDSDPGTPDVGPVGSAETNATGAGRSHTVAGMVLGTRRSLAPDQAAGHNHQAGPAWDVWALGVMLHELLTGQPPRSSDAPERLLNTVEPDNPPPTRVKPGLDPRLSRVVKKCLARDAADRYPNGSAVAGT